MDERQMSDGYLRADVNALLIREVDDGAILHIASASDLDTIDVGTQDSIVPDTGVFC